MNGNSLIGSYVHTGAEERAVKLATEAMDGIDSLNVLSALVLPVLKLLLSAKTFNETLKDLGRLR